MATEFARKDDEAAVRPGSIPGWEDAELRASSHAGPEATAAASAPARMRAAARRVAARAADLLSPGSSGPRTPAEPSPGDSAASLAHRLAGPRAVIDPGAPAAARPVTAPSDWTADTLAWTTTDPAASAGVTAVPFERAVSAASDPAVAPIEGNSAAPAARDTPPAERASARDEALHWLDHLPHTLGAQAHLMRQLIVVARADARIRTLAARGSVGRGDPDGSADLDIAMGVDDSEFTATADDVAANLQTLGDVVDVLMRRLGELGELPHRDCIVQYANGVRLDLLIRPLGGWGRGRRPGMIVLYDPDGHFASALEPPEQPVAPERVREWALLGWLALAECGRHVRRGAGWAAFERLNEARAYGWRLWATARGLPNPERGVYASAEVSLTALPPGLEATRPTRDLDLLRAALACSYMLDALWLEATAVVMGVPQPRPPLASWAREQLVGSQLLDLPPGD